MKNLLLLMVVPLFIWSCATNTLNNPKEKNPRSVVQNDTVKIENKELGYEVIIFEPGFNAWINTQAQPRGFYSENFLEGRNRIFVSEWNRRVMQPQVFDPNLYEMQINYDAQTRYGYEVNYLIYNYFMYFQLTYKQQLSGFVPRYN